jgi:hypothetical protein
LAEKKEIALLITTTEENEKRKEVTNFMEQSNS